MPGLSEDLSKWPATYMISAEKDVCRDDAKLFHEKLQAAGRPSKMDFYDGLPHYFHCEYSGLTKTSADICSVPAIGCCP